MRRPDTECLQRQTWLEDSRLLLSTQPPSYSTMPFITRLGLRCHHQTKFASVKNLLSFSMISFIDHATDQPHQTKGTPSWLFLCTLWNSNSGLQRESDYSFFLCLHFCFVGGQGLRLKRGRVAGRAGEEVCTGSPHLSPKEGASLGPVALFPPCPHPYGMTPV